MLAFIYYSRLQGKVRNSFGSKNNCHSLIEKQKNDRIKKSEKNHMKKILQTITAFFVSAVFLSDKVSAALLYGPPPERVIPLVTEKVPPSIVDLAFWTLEKTLAFIIAPIVIIVSIIVGVVIHIKRKRKPIDVTTNIQDRQP